LNLSSDRLLDGDDDDDGGDDDICHRKLAKCENMKMSLGFHATANNAFTVLP
jgi:hypothetical protein